MFHNDPEGRHNFISVPSGSSFKDAINVVMATFVLHLKYILLVFHMEAPLYFIVLRNKDNFTFGLLRYLDCLVPCMCIPVFFINIESSVLGCIC